MSSNQTSTQAIISADFWMVIADANYITNLRSLKGLSTKQKHKWKSHFYDEKGVRTRIVFDNDRLLAYDADMHKWRKLVSISSQHRWMDKQKDGGGMKISEINEATGESVVFCYGDP